MSDGSRRVTSISEITGMEGETITMQEIFLYERTGVDKEGTGAWVASVQLVFVHGSPNG